MADFVRFPPSANLKGQAVWRKTRVQYCMPYRIVRFKLKTFDGAREIELVRRSPVVDGPVPALGQIVQVVHHGVAFEAKVVWSIQSKTVADLFTLRVEEI